MTLFAYLPTSKAAIRSLENKYTKPRMEKPKDLVAHSAVTFVWFAGHGDIIGSKKADAQCMSGTTENSTEFLHVTEATPKRGKRLVLQKLHSLAKVR